MNRFDKSCVRAFFTLPRHLLEKENTFIETKYNQQFRLALRTAGSISYKETTFYIIWFDSPEEIAVNETIDLSFRDFSAYDLPPVVLIRKSSK